MGIRVLEDLISSVRTWPSDDVAELLDVARVIEARRTGCYQMSPDERAAIVESLAQARRGEFLSDEETEAV